MRLAGIATVLAAALGLTATALQAGARDAGVPDERGEPDGGAGSMGEALDSAMNGVALSRAAEAKQLLRRKDYTGALERYREAHDLAPANAEIANNLGYIYFLLGNDDEAERLYRLSLSLGDAGLVRIRVNDRELGFIGDKGETRSNLAFTAPKAQAPAKPAAPDESD